MLNFTRNYFELFGLPVGFLVDIDELRERYRDLQRVLHPDRFAGSSEQERRLSMQGTAHINQAYETLKDPLKRALYLLELHGVETGPDHETTRDTGFLMEQLELREELAQLGDQPDALAAVQVFLERIEGMIRTTVGKIAVDFETPEPRKLARVLESVRRMQFLNKLHSEAEAVEARLEDEIS
jgi:molecular chaperone HscB